jgi:hypothetical protein
MHGDKPTMSRKPKAMRVIDEPCIPSKRSNGYVNTSWSSFVNSVARSEHEDERTMSMAGDTYVSTRHVTSI